MDEKEVKVNGTRIIYFQGGAGPALVLLPSAGGRGKEYSDLFPCLTPFFSVYTLDYPGFGRSGEVKGIEGIEKLAEFVTSWLHSIGIPQFYLVGFSMGGAIALQMALKSPDQILKLCVIATAAGKIKNIPIISPIGLNLKQILDSFYFRPETKAKIKNKKLTPEEKREIHRSSQTFAKMIKNSKVFINIIEKLQQIRCPTLVIAGEKDRATPLPYQEVIFKNIPSAKWKAYPETGHFIIIERPEELAADLVHFFK